MLPSTLIRFQSVEAGDLFYLQKEGCAVQHPQEFDENAENDQGADAGNAQDLMASYQPAIHHAVHSAQMQIASRQHLLKMLPLLRYVAHHVLAHSFCYQ